MRRILLVGAGGLAEAITRTSWLKDFQYDIISLSLSDKKYRVDISSKESVQKYFESSEPYDVVINTAAMTNVDACEASPSEARAVNALGVKHLAHMCLQYNSALLQVSTDYVFSGNRDKPYEISDATGPCSIYGQTKLEGEYYAMNIPLVSAVVRSTWLFGADKNDFVNMIFEKLIQDKAVKAVANQDACPTSVVDLSEALGKITLELLLPSREEALEDRRIVHFTNKGITTRYGMALLMNRILKSKSNLSIIQPRDLESWIALRPKYSALSNESYMTSFRPHIRPWQEALEDYIVGKLNRLKDGIL